MFIFTETQYVVHVFQEKTKGKTKYVFIVIFIAFHTHYTINTVHVFVSEQVTGYKMEKE